MVCKTAEQFFNLGGSLCRGMGGSVYCGIGGSVCAYSPITNNLRIETGDTLFIQAANQSSLTVNDSLIIESVTSAIVVSNNSIKYPIFVRGHWENNGFFDAGESRVTFDGTISDQQIGGQSMSTFFDLEISNASHVLRLADFTVIDTLSLINGRLKLNLGMMTLLNPNPLAINRINGFIQCENDLLSANVHPFGRLNWKMGNSPGLRVIPFINSFGIPIFLDYEIISGFHDVIVGTYGTYPNNTNLPLPEVTNVYSYFNGLIDSSGNTAVDRFYLLDNSMGTNPVAEVTFRYSSAEQAANGNSVMGAQRWLNASNIWENPHLPMQVFYPGAGGSVHITISDSVFASSIWWTISSLSGALGTGLADVKNEELARVYPNPAYSGDMLKLVIREQSFMPDLVQLFTVDGREILIEDFQQGSHSIRIPYDLSSGVYTLLIKDIMKTGIIRLVIFDR